MSEKFQQWWDSGEIFQIDPYLDDSYTDEIAQYSWQAALKEVIKVLDKYSNSPDIKYIKEEIEKL